jgi:hypothetical protein
MRRLLAVILVVVGVASLGLAALPWIWIRFVRPPGYHAYYVMPDAHRIMLAEVAAGAILIGTGAFLIAIGRLKRG